MEREVVKNNRSLNRGEGLCRAPTETATTTTSATSTADFVLQWGNRKRLRCMKFHVKDDSTVKTTVRVERRVVRAVDKDTLIYTATTTTATADNNNLNLRRHPPPPPPPPPRILRNSESSCTMRGQSNGVRGGSSSSDRGGGGGEKVKEKKVNKPSNAAGGGSPSSEMGQDGKKGGSSSGSEAIPVWPPKFVIALTNKEKEEDFMAIKGSKLPQRPKKRAKFIQRNLNLVCPGSWLCDLTLERYEVREKKISKKRARGLKAMGNMDSDSD